MESSNRKNSGQMSTFDKLFLLLWKNHLLQIRHYIQTILDVTLPLLIFLFCAWIYTYDEKNFSPRRAYRSLPLEGSE